MVVVLEARHLLAAAVTISAVTLASLEWFFSDNIAVQNIESLLAAGGASLCAGGALWITRRTGRQAKDSRRLDRTCARLVIASLALLALVPWTVHAASFTAAPHLIALMIVVSAFVCVVGLAPFRRMVAASAALPLSPALANLIDFDAAHTTVGLACGFAGAFTALLAWRLHHHWCASVRVAIEQRDRIRMLEAARDVAIKADQEKNRFLVIASHDLRQPVHAIGLFAATLEKRLESSAELPLIRNMRRALDGLDRSFNVMLDISRLDSGAIEPQVQQFQLQDLFRRLHMHFAGQAEQKGLGLRFSPGGKSISSDPQLIERILGNLVQNAIKYTEFGGIAVVARSTESHINVEIWDTGVGICEADLRKVFDEFFQVQRGERVRTQGLGMGLAIVKRLVRLLGHELIVVSKPGRGTMFRLRIARGGLPDIQDFTAGADTLPMPLLQPRTVLVIDDEEAIREGLCLLLQEWGYDAIAAGSIAQAERAVGQLGAPPDMILSDLHLGDGPDGIAGIEAIRRQCGCDVTAMLITGDTSPEEVRRATQSGYPVLFKPVQPRKLYDALRGLAS